MVDARLNGWKPQFFPRSNWIQLAYHQDIKSMLVDFTGHFRSSLVKCLVGEGHQSETMNDYVPAAEEGPWGRSEE